MDLEEQPRAGRDLPGDVGRRRYLRLVLEDGSSVIGVVYPAEETDSRHRWNSARAVLRERLEVPLLIADDQMGLIFGAFWLAYALFELPGGWVGGARQCQRPSWTPWFAILGRATSASC